MRASAAYCCTCIPCTYVRLETTCHLLCIAFCSRTALAIVHISLRRRPVLYISSPSFSHSSTRITCLMGLAASLQWGCMLSGRASFCSPTTTAPPLPRLLLLLPGRVPRIPLGIQLQRQAARAASRGGWQGRAGRRRSLACTPSVQRRGRTPRCTTATTPAPAAGAPVLPPTPTPTPPPPPAQPGRPAPAAAASAPGPPARAASETTCAAAATPPPLHSQ